MHFSLSALIAIALSTSSAIAILPPPSEYRIYQRPSSNIIRPAVCSSNPHSPLYCKGTNGGGSIDRREPQFRAQVCSSNPNSPFYCNGFKQKFKTTKHSESSTPEPNHEKRIINPCTFSLSSPGEYARCRSRLNPFVVFKRSETEGTNGGSSFDRRDPQFRAQVCSSNPYSPFYCKGFKQKFKTTKHSESSTPEPNHEKRIINPCTFSLSSPGEYARCRSRLNPFVVYKRSETLVSVAKRATKKLLFGGACSPFAISGCGCGIFTCTPYMNSVKRNAALLKERPVRMQVCSFDPKSPNYCPGEKKDTEKPKPYGRTKGGRNSPYVF